MLTRVSRYAHDPAIPIHVVVAPTFTDALNTIAQDLQSLLGNHNEGHIEVYAAPHQITTTDLGILQAPASVKVYTVNADPEFTNGSRPRAEITLTVTTQHTSGPQNGRPRFITRHWELRICPPGTPHAVHELTETLLCDAEEAGEPIPHSEALSIAHAIHTS